METTVITIDGPAGAGKSTVAKKLAHKLGFSYLDTGAMYRAMTLKAMRAGIDLENVEQLIKLAKKTSIELKGDGSNGLKVFLDGQDVSADIRSLEVTNNTFYIARTPQIREIMVEWQRAIGRKENIVVEGRDVGTVVFPQATRKFFLDANFDERTQRRFLELKEKGKDVDKAALKDDLKDRDTKDITRPVGPLKKADDAVLIDSTRLTVEQVVEKMLSHIK